MSNSFYTHGSFPSTGSAATSATMRNELDLITQGFDKLPTLASGSANQVVVLSATGLAMTTTSSLNGISIGSTTPSTGAFTTLSASSTVSGAGFTTYLASPPAIGGTAAAAITGTTITANTGFAGALNGTVGATTPAAGAFTTLSASGTVSGAGGAWAGAAWAGGTAAAAGTFTALTYSTTLTGGTGIVNLGSGQFYKDASGKVGIGTNAPAVTFAISATDAVLLPTGTTAQRPTGATGYIRYNSSLNQFEGYGASAWGSIGGGATGANGEQVFWENEQSVDASYTITAGRNAGTFGPVTVASGVTVTVPSGSVWSVV